MTDRGSAPRRYYHQRTGSQQPPKLDLAGAKKLIAASYKLFLSRDYFQQALGYYCVDAGSVAGACGEDVEGWIHVNAWLENVYPFDEKLGVLDEPTTFAVIELLWDLVSAPLEEGGFYHSFSNCGWHYEKFDRSKGRSEWRDAMNKVLEFYSEGFELSAQGEIQRIGEPGLAEIMSAPIPKSANQENIDKMTDAVHRFRSGRSSRKDRQDAVEDLVKVLEFFRPQVKQHMFRKDEDRLFEIANEFSVRHHNQRQKSDYDPAWLSWMFYLYLSTIHLVLRLIERETGS